MLQCNYERSMKRQVHVHGQFKLVLCRVIVTDSSMMSKRNLISKLLIEKFHFKCYSIPHKSAPSQMYSTKVSGD